MSEKHFIGFYIDLEKRQALKTIASIMGVPAVHIVREALDEKIKNLSEREDKTGEFIRYSLEKKEIQV